MEDLKWLDELPLGCEYNPPERIVCACNKYKDHLNNDILICGVRHFCGAMTNSYQAYSNSEVEIYIDTEVQGFITSKYRFVNRQEAWKIAAEQKQIVRRVGGDTSKGGTLYSENLY